MWHGSPQRGQVLADIAYRTRYTLNLDPKTGHIVGDRDAANLWSREYREGWETRV